MALFSTFCSYSNFFYGFWRKMALNDVQFGTKGTHFVRMSGYCVLLPNCLIYEYGIFGLAIFKVWVYRNSIF